MSTAGERTAQRAGVLALGGRAHERADNWSMGTAAALTLFVPVWFYAAHLWNPGYVPVRPWVWAAPWFLCMIYLYFQFWLLLISAGRSDRIGMADTVVSMVAFLSVFATAIVLIVLWTFDRYNLAFFQAMTIFALIVTTLGELVFTAWVRYLVNRRYFAGVPFGHE
jgi:hypothetical protein